MRLRQAMAKPINFPRIGPMGFAALNPSYVPTYWLGRSIPRISRRARKRDRVAHIGEPRHIGERALEAEPKARVRHGAVAAQIAVPAVVLLVDAALGHAGVEHVEALLALAAADDLADARRQHIHGGDGFAVVVYPHVEGLDVLGVVHHHDRLLGVL